MEGRFRRLARHWNRIELHVDGGQRRLDEERHQEEEGEETEDSQQQEEGRQSEFDILSHGVVLLFCITGHLSALFPPHSLTSFRFFLTSLRFNESLDTARLSRIQSAAPFGRIHIS